MSTSKKPLAIVAAVIVLAFVGWGLYQAFQPQRLPLQGQMDAQEVNVSSKVPGRVGELYVKLGQTVLYAMRDVLEFERHGLRKPLPRQVAPDEPTPPEVIQNLTVRDVVAVLRTDVQ